MANEELCNSLCKLGVVPSEDGTKRRKRRRKPRLTGLSKQRQTANARERLRMRSISTALRHLRHHLPTKFAPKDKRLSKIQTLRYAIRYITELLQILHSSDRQGEEVVLELTANKTSSESLTVKAADLEGARRYRPTISADDHGGLHSV